MKSVCVISCGLEFIKNVLTILTEFTHLLGREALHTIVVGAQGDSGQRMWSPPCAGRPTITAETPVYTPASATPLPVS